VSDTLQEALAALRKQRTELDELTTTVRVTPRVARLDLLPRVRVPRVSDEDDAPVLPPTLSPQEVLSAWTRGKAAWLAQRGRRDLSAVVASLAAPSAGPQLARDDTFSAALLPLLRPRQQWRALTALFFQSFPPSTALSAAVHRVRHADPERAPEWSRSVGNLQPFLASLGQAIATHDWASVRGQWQLPESVSTSGWASAVVANALVGTLEELERLLLFVDGGEERVAPTPLRDAHLPLVRAMVVMGQNAPSMRLRIAALLRRRIGDVFGVADSASWRGLEAERSRVRAWVAAEILDILFKHLVPNSEYAHHTEPRRQFWGRYTGCVDRLWLLIGPRLRQRLERGEIKDLLQKVGDVIEIRELHGQDQQAIVWMQLRAAGGRVVTVIEGNANSRCRLGTGSYEPPRKAAVDYSHDIVHGPLGDHGAHTFSQAHLGDWQRKVSHALLERGIRP
jgi:hypothetical protein